MDLGSELSGGAHDDGGYVVSFEVFDTEDLFHGGHEEGKSLSASSNSLDNIASLACVVALYKV